MKKQGILTSIDNSHIDERGPKLASSPAPHGPPHSPHFTFIGYQGTLSRSQFFICCEFSDEAAQTQSPQAGKMLLTLLKKGEHEGRKTQLNLKVRHKGEFALLMIESQIHLKHDVTMCSKGHHTQELSRKPKLHGDPIQTAQVPSIALALKPLPINGGSQETRVPRLLQHLTRKRVG